MPSRVTFVTVDQGHVHAAEFVAVDGTVTPLENIHPLIVYGYQGRADIAPDTKGSLRFQYIDIPSGVVTAMSGLSASGATAAIPVPEPAMAVSLIFGAVVLTGLARLKRRDTCESHY